MIKLLYFFRKWEFRINRIIRIIINKESIFEFEGFLWVVNEFSRTLVRWNLDKHLHVSNQFTISFATNKKQSCISIT